jgi:hypothetical protein
MNAIFKEIRVSLKLNCNRVTLNKSLLAFYYQLNFIYLKIRYISKKIKKVQNLNSKFKNDKNAK